MRLKDATDDHGIVLNDLTSCSCVKVESFRRDLSESAFLVTAINTIEVKMLTRNNEFVKSQGAIWDGSSAVTTPVQITKIVA